MSTECARFGTLPWPYEILGLVDAAMSATSGIVPTAHLMARLQDQALAWGADAVIGIRVSEFTLPGAIGTAVRELPEEDAGDSERGG